MAKVYTFKYYETTRVDYFTYKRTKDITITGTIAELREMLGMDEIVRISWADKNDPDSKPTKVNTAKRLEHFYNRLNRNKKILNITTR